MSYDLTFLPLPADLTLDLAYQQWIEQQERENVNLPDFLQQTWPEATRQRGEQIADALIANWPNFVRFRSASPLPWIELNDETTQIQVTIYADSVGMHIPYFRQPVENLLRVAQCCLRLFIEEGGFFAYDPQLGRPISASDLSEIERLYRWMDKQPFDVKERATKPWWKFW